jgi:hypothetical protein
MDTPQLAAQNRLLYQELIVWRRVDDATAVRYRCLRSFATNQYSIQSVDFYRVPYDRKSASDWDAQFVELFCESDPAERAGAFDSVEEAIAAHERDFGPPPTGRR